MPVHAHGKITLYEVTGQDMTWLYKGTGRMVIFLVTSGLERYMMGWDGMDDTFVLL